MAYRRHRKFRCPVHLPGRVTRRSQFATAKLASVNTIGRDSVLAARYAEASNFSREKTGGCKPHGRRDKAPAAGRRADPRRLRATAPRLRLVYAETSAKLFGVCLRILGDRSEAEDVLQDVYLTVWRKAASFDESGRARSPGSWRSRATAPSTVCAPSAASRRSAPIEAADDVRDAGPSALERLENDEQEQAG